MRRKPYGLQLTRVQTTNEGVRVDESTRLESHLASCSVTVKLESTQLSRRHREARKSRSPTSGCRHS